MLDKLKESLGSVKLLIWVLIVLYGIFAFTDKFVGMPERVAMAEGAIKKTQSSVDRLANTVESYIIEQKIYHKGLDKLRESQEKREDMMFQLITKVRSERNDN